MYVDILMIFPYQKWLCSCWPIHLKHAVLWMVAKSESPVENDAFSYRLSTILPSTISMLQNWMMGEFPGNPSIFPFRSWEFPVQCGAPRVIFDAL